MTAFRTAFCAALAAAVQCGAAFALEPVARQAGEEDFIAIYREMVETDTSPSTGSCTRLAALIRDRLSGAGFSDNEAKLVVPEGAPEDGNVIARIPGGDPGSKGVLLLAHIDVVDARRADWERDPFVLAEEEGFFFGRGAADDKSMAAVFLDLMIRLKREGYRPRRDLKMALTCGEETSGRVNGVDYLLRNLPDAVRADFAINEGAGGLLGPSGRPLALNVQAGEKIHQVMVLEVVNPGGHSSRPVRENAIYQLAAALRRLEAHAFPVEMTPVTRAYFERIGPIVGGDMGRAMSTLARRPSDRRALQTVTSDPTYNAMLRTTCVATQLDAGHAPNALPQRARAVLSCRVMQGTSLESVRDILSSVIADAGVKVSIEKAREGSSPPELTEEVMEPVRRIAAEIWPGAVVAPVMAAGATDGRFLMNAGVPTYGMSGMFSLPGETNAHGLNEKIRRTSLLEGRRFLEAVVRAYTAP